MSTRRGGKAASIGLPSPTLPRLLHLQILKVLFELLLFSFQHKKVGKVARLNLSNSESPLCFFFLNLLLNNGRGAFMELRLPVLL